MLFTHVGRILGSEVCIDVWFLSTILNILGLHIFSTTCSCFLTKFMIWRAILLFTPHPFNLRFVFPDKETFFPIGARFKKYVGHSAHVTNVRFTYDKGHVISVGGADNAIFQWRFLPTGEEVEVEDGEEEEENEREEQEVGGGGDSDSEASDSDMSDVEALDSDLEKEQEKSYER